MTSISCLARRNTWTHFVTLTLTALLVIPVAQSTALAQGGGQTGTIAGRVTDEHGAPVASAQVFLDRTALGTLTRG